MNPTSDIRYNTTQTSNFSQVPVDSGDAQGCEISRQEQLLSYVAHEVRMPMQGVYGSLQHLAEQETLSGQAKQEVLSAIAQTEYVVELLNDVLDISQIRNGGLKKKIEAASRDEFLQFLDKVLAPMAENRGLIFERRMSESPYAYLYLDQQKLQQILINLVSNAIKHAKPELVKNGAKVTLRCQFEKIEVNRVGLSLTIEDNGKGMEPSVLNQIYTPFLMGRAEEHRRSAGLGMTIVKYLIELLNGSIHMESKPGIGTKATITLQCDGADEWYGKKEETFHPKKETVLSEKLLERMGKLHVLAAEDEELAMEALARDMKSLQIQMDRTYDGEEASDIFAQSKEGYYDMLFLDCEMPEKDGLTAAQEIRQMKRTDSKDIPIVMMSGNPDEDIQKAAAKGVITAWIQKPFGKKQLIELMSQHLGEEREK